MSAYEFEKAKEAIGVILEINDILNQGTEKPAHPSFFRELRMDSGIKIGDIIKYYNKFVELKERKEYLFMIRKAVKEINGCGPFSNDIDDIINLIDQKIKNTINEMASEDRKLIDYK